MSRFPKTEPEIAGRCWWWTGSDRRRRIFRPRREQAAKDQALIVLKDSLKADLRYAEVEVRGQSFTRS